MTDSAPAASPPVTRLPAAPRSGAREAGGGDAGAKEAGSSRPDPRWLRTREAILRAGQMLFSSHHLEGVAIDDLIRAAGVSKQSFYNHFRDRDELARDILRMIRQDIDRLVEAAIAPETDPARRIATAICLYGRQALTNPAQGWLIARLPLEDIATDSETNANIIRDMGAGIASGRLTGFNPETGLAYVLGVVQGLVHRILSDGQPAPAAETSRQCLAMLLRAFGLDGQEAGTMAAEIVDQVMAGKRAA
ncbi:MAG: TetR/AcrR family transcriptional regulator [Sphingobium sp.]